MAMAKVIPIIESPEAEQAVLGAILLRPESLDRIKHLIKPADFYRQSHGRIFQAMLELSGRSYPVDLVTVSAFLKGCGQLEGVGGPVFLAGLSEQVGFATNVDYYAGLVLSKAVLRRTREAAQEIVAACDGQIDNIPEFLSQVEARIFELTQAEKAKGLRGRAEAILEISEFLEKELSQRKTYLEPWLKEASINMITGWRGTGKTGFVMGLLSAISMGESFGPWQINNPAPCLYFDGEMVQQDTAERCASLYRVGIERENFFIYSDHYCNLLGLPGANLLDENWRAWMQNEVLLKRGIKLWVLDNIGSVTAGIDENSREAWSPINRWFLDLRFAGISSILLHHEGKLGAQRGTSAREDNLDISISLKRPQDYRPEDGARFICHFEKARIRHKDLHQIADIEFQMDTDPEGKVVWTYRNLKRESKARVLRMIDEGLTRKEIANSLMITGPRVSQIKAEAVKEGLITDAGKLTQSGFAYISQRLTKG